MFRLKSLACISSKSATWGEALYVLECLIRLDDPGDVLGVDEVLRLALAEAALLGRVHE